MAIAYRRVIHIVDQSRKKSQELSEQERRYMRQGAGAIRMGWIAILAFLCLPIVTFIAEKVPGRASGRIFFCYGIVTLAGALASCGTCIFIMLKARCPACGWMLLYPPDKGFRANPACPKIRCCNAWSYQVMRARKKMRFMCISCGRDYDIS